MSKKPLEPIRPKIRMFVLDFSTLNTFGAIRFREVRYNFPPTGLPIMIVGTTFAGTYISPAVLRNSMNMWIRPTHSYRNAEFISIDDDNSEWWSELNSFANGKVEPLRKTSSAIIAVIKKIQAAVAEDEKTYRK